VLERGFRAEYLRPRIAQEKAMLFTDLPYLLHSVILQKKNKILIVANEGEMVGKFKI